MRTATHRLVAPSVDTPPKVVEEEVVEVEKEVPEEDDLEYSDEEEDEEDEEGASSRPPWAKGISEDVNNHIKYMRVPPILRGKTFSPEQERPLYGSPMAAGHSTDREAWQVSSSNAFCDERV